MKKKPSKAEINTEEAKKEPTPKFFTCTTCEEQCAGHGGGVPALEGGCLCFDGVHLECLI